MDTQQQHSQHMNASGALEVPVIEAQAPLHVCALPTCRQCSFYDFCNSFVSMHVFALCPHAVYTTAANHYIVILFTFHWLIVQPMNDLFFPLLAALYRALQHV